MMRIITGTARGTKLDVPAGMTTRPTAERTKEAVFSSLQFNIRGRHVLDLFAGSGQMGLEALSRGAELAYFCDRSADAVKTIRSNAEKTHLADKCRIYSIDSQEFLLQNAGKLKFDIVFIDPPYSSGLVPLCLKKLVAGKLLTNGAMLVCETPRGVGAFGDDSDLGECFDATKTSVYGAAEISILRFRGDDNADMADTGIKKDKKGEGTT